MRKTILIFISILSSCWAFAQHELSVYGHKFTEVLKDIENKRNVKFSYNPEWFSDQLVDFSFNDESVDQLLNKLQHQVHFSYRKIDERYFVIKRLSKINICGQIKEKRTKNDLERVSIYNGSKTKITSSDEYGYFTLDGLKINDTVIVNSLGFKTIKIPINKFFKDCRTFYLEELHETLNEVVIKEYLSSSISLKKDGIVSFDLKKPDILAGQGEPDVLQSVQLLPGIDSTTENATDLIIRGSNPDKNLILWDGIKLYNTDHFFGTLTNLNSSIIDNVSIHKSGVNAQYGDRVSGVIDINLDNEVPNKIESSLGLNLLHSDFSIKIPVTKKIGVIASTRRSHVDFYKSNAFTNNFNRIFQNSRVKINRSVFDIDTDLEQEQTLIYEDHSAKLVYDVTPKHKLSGTVLYTNNKYDDTASFLANNAFSDNGVTFFDLLRIKNLGASLIYNSEWSDKITTSVTAKHSNYRLTYLGYNFNPIFLFPFGLERENGIEEYSTDLNLKYDINKFWNISIGYELLSARIKSKLGNEFGTDFDTDQKNKPTHSMYKQVFFNKAKLGSASLGVRVNKFANFDQLKWEPRLSLEKNLSKNLRLKTSAEIRNQSINRITISSGFDNGEENEVWVPSIQDSIPLLKNTQLSAGIIFNKRNWIVDIDAYYKKSEGLITLQNRSAELLFDFTPDEGEGTVKGIDFFIKKKIKSYSTWLGYTYAINKQTFENINEGKTFNADNDIRHSLTWSHFLQWKNLQFSLGWKYRTGIPFTVIETLALSSEENDIVESFNEERIPDYHRLDFSITYSIGFLKNENKKKAKIGLSIQNIYNRKNILNTTFSRLVASKDVDVDLTKPVEFRTESLGITPNVFLRFNF
ncbi:TonB-dependent receptor [Aquimarina agarilytica]|uniref:TonB-dependent receptor n=1 Tax=Aquimarina agarilytica TaxID=1087449 RepID=UPI00028938E6|nr:TonB-dependent receptor [Aquimarina agarilytica]